MKSDELKAFFTIITVKNKGPGKEKISRPADSQLSERLLIRRFLKMGMVMAKIQGSLTRMDYTMRVRVYHLIPQRTLRRILSYFDMAYLSWKACLWLPSPGPFFGV
jgi:hypothetical protein